MSLDSIRMALRTLRKQPGFTTVVVLSLALAIALNTTMYGVLDALINPRVDIRRPEDVFSVRLYGDYRNRVSTAQRDSAVRAGLRNIEAVALEDNGFGARSTLEAGNNFVEGGVSHVSYGYFDLIGPRVIAGRTFIAADVDASPQPIVLGEAAAAVLFPGGAAAVGSTVRFSDTAFTVIGVVSRYSDFPDRRSEGWVIAESDQSRMFSRMIRLRPGSSAQAAQRDLDVVAQRIALASETDPKGVAFRFSRPAAPQFHAKQFHIAIVLAVIAVLLVACANLANMQLARGIARRRELALRSALGATRGKIVGHLLTESVLLAVGGLLLGIALTFSAAALLRASIPPAVGDYVVEPQMSWRVFVFALAATVTCVVLVGLFPAVRVSRVDPNEMLKSGAGTGATRKHRRQYGYLVAAEIALALGLLSGASMMVRSATNLQSDEIKVDLTPIVMAAASTGRVTTETSLPVSRVLQEAAARAAAVPGVAMAAASMNHGVTGAAVTISDSARGLREIPAPNYNYEIVSPSYLRTLRLPIVRGRDFLDGERDDGSVIVDEYTAAGLWPNGNPIGALIKLGDMKSNAPFVRVIGVAGLISRRRGGLPSINESRLRDIYYLPGPQDSIAVAPRSVRYAIVTIRASGNPARLLPVLRHAGILAPRWIGGDAIRERQSKRFVAALFSFFAAMGLGLAAFGVYGVVAHSVAERRRELGVRIALGASSRDILRAVLRESVAIALVGIALGLLATKRTAPMLVAFAIPDDVYNAPLFAGAALILLGAAAASAFVPAMRATRVDPTESLRSE
jgi:putative ABC transport system permease protein